MAGGRGKGKDESGELEGGREEANNQEKKTGRKSAPLFKTSVASRGIIPENTSAELKVRGGYLHDHEEHRSQMQGSPRVGFFLVTYTLFKRNLLHTICLNGSFHIKV